MTHCERQARSTPDPLTGERHEWTVTSPYGPVRWRGYTGPLRLDEAELDDTCRRLLGVERDALQRVALEHIETVVAHGGGDGDGPRLILHSTTPILRAFEADLAAMSQSRTPLDFTTYAETRALYLARPGDLAVGRTYPWRLALADSGIDGLVLEDTDHYYLSHALLHRARERGSADPALARILTHLRENPAGVVSLYALEPELQLLLSWLAREAGLERIYLDANDPRIAASWNRKGLLHPSVGEALELEAECADADVERVLELEQRASEAFAILDLTIPVVPGYTIPSRPRRETFVAELLRAGELLRARHGLSRVCLKPSEGGDGGRIVPGIELAPPDRLEALGERAWEQGGDFVLEAHVDYLALGIEGERVYTTPSAHVRDRALLEGLTLQFMRGSSWKGNIYVDGAGWSSLGLDPRDHARVESAMAALSAALLRRGLTRAGVDFAVGRLGGRYGDSVRVAVQDINIKLTGAMFMRAFMDRHGAAGPRYAATRVFVPRLGVTPTAVRERLASRPAEPHEVNELIAVVPGRWGMLAGTGASPADAAAHALMLERSLIVDELADDPHEVEST